MHTQARYYIRTALAYLLAAFLVGGAVLINQALAIDARIAALQPVFYHLLMVGWVTQLIFGVVFWMFPKYSAERPRGNEVLGWAVYGLLNSGLVLRAVSEPWMALAGGVVPGALLALAALLQWLAGLGFVLNTWVRVKER